MQQIKKKIANPDQKRPHSARQEYIQSLEKGIMVIKAFGNGREDLTMAEIARLVGLSRAATRRFLFTLETLGYVRSEGRYFRLQPKLLELGYSYLASIPWWRHAQHRAEELARDTGLPAAVSVLDGDHTVYVALANPQPFLALGNNVGTKFPAFISAGGRVLIAHMEEAQREKLLAKATLPALTPLTITDPDKLRKVLAQVKEQGFAGIDEELNLGVRSLAVPIFDRNYRVPGALGISVRVPNISMKELMQRYLPKLRATASSISEQLPS